MALTEAEELELLQLKAKSSPQVPFSQKVRDFGVSALKGGALETAGTLAGGLGGGALGAGAGGVGAIPGAVAGSAAGAAIGKNLEDVLLHYLDDQSAKSFGEETQDVLGAGARGATAEMGGQVIGKVLSMLGEKVLSPAGRWMKDRVAPRIMTSAVKDEDLAREMLKRGEWGTARSLLEKGETGVADLSSQVDDLLSKSNNPIDRLKIVDQLEDLRKEYARLPGREGEVASIQDLQAKIFQSPSKEALRQGVTDYANLPPPKANELKRAIYSENKKLYQGGNYDPASIRSQTDMATARGLKEAIEDIAPDVKPLNEELGHNIQLRDAMETISGKAEKANLVQLRPLIVGLGLISQGALPAAAAPAGMNWLGTTAGGTSMAQLAQALGERMAQRGGTPITNWLTKYATQRSLRD